MLITTVFVWGLKRGYQGLLTKLKIKQKEKENCTLMIELKLE